jgi:hypothetical protein
LNIHPAHKSIAMKALLESTWFRLTAGLLLIAALSGCQSWQSSHGIPGLGASKKERGIVKQARNDPFPSPEQVGMEARQ